MRGKKIEVELRSDAEFVVIGGDQCADIFAQVNSDNRFAARANMLVHPTQQGGRFGWKECRS